MDGDSVRFEWDGGPKAGGGSCSGRKTGLDTLDFGATTFYSGDRPPTPKVSYADGPIDKTFAEQLKEENAKNHENQPIFKGLLSNRKWIGKNSSGKTLLFSCGEPTVYTGGNWEGCYTVYDQFEILEPNGKSVFTQIPANLEPFSVPGQGQLGTREQFTNYFAPRFYVMQNNFGEHEWQFYFYIRNFSEDGRQEVLHQKVSGRFISTNLLTMKFEDDVYGRVYFSPTTK